MLTVVLTYLTHTKAYLQPSENNISSTNKKLWFLYSVDKKPKKIFLVRCSAASNRLKLETAINALINAGSSEFYTVGTGLAQQIVQPHKSHK